MTNLKKTALGSIVCGIVVGGIHYVFEQVLNVPLSIWEHTFVVFSVCMLTLVFLRRRRKH